MFNMLMKLFLIFHRLKKILNASAFVVLAMSLSGCYIDAAILGLGSNQSPLEFQKTNGAEFVSGSDQYAQTPSRYYKINSSLGSMTKETQSDTPRGYKIFSTVQGELISAQEVQ